MPMRPVARIMPPMKLGPSNRLPLRGAAVVGRDAVVVCGSAVVLLFGVLGVADVVVVGDLVVVGVLLVVLAEVVTLGFVVDVVEGDVVGGASEIRHNKNLKHLQSLPVCYFLYFGIVLY